MTRCHLCCMPDTRPDTQFTDGICSACISYARRKGIDWTAREKRLLELLDQHHGECIVASSGGKDSHWQTLKLLELGAHVTCVTATTCHLTDIGRKNLDNLAQYATTIEVSPNKTVRAKLNRLGLQLVGDLSWAEHVSIFTTPFRLAADIGIPLIFYGENPQEAYGGPTGADAAFELTPRWRSEFGGFLGLRPSDMVGKEGITERDMEKYTLPISRYDGTFLTQFQPKAYFLGQFCEWDSHRNARVAMDHGMIADHPSPSNHWSTENLDNAQTGIHDYFCWLKYGYGRACAQVSVDIRAGLATREQGLKIVERRDGLFPSKYAGVTLEEILERIGLTNVEFDELARSWECSQPA